MEEVGCESEIQGKRSRLGVSILGLAVRAQECKRNEIRGTVPGILQCLEDGEIKRI